MQLSSLSFGLSKSPFHLSQYSVSEMHSGVLSSSRSTGWRLILQIRWTFNIWVRPSGKSFADKNGGKGDLPGNLNAAASSCWKNGHDALTITSVSEMCPTAVIWLFWAQDSFWVPRRYWLPCHISKMSWTLAILWNFLSSASFFNSELLSVFVASHCGTAPAKILLLAWANCLTTTISRRVLPVVFDSLQPITSQPRETLASTPTPCGMIENMSGTTLGRPANLKCISSCWCHQLDMSSNHNVQLISIGSGW